jgi:hypothetical protein
VSANDDPRCPECGEAISATASYCMHCYTDLSDVDLTDRVHRDDATDGVEYPGAERNEGDYETMTDASETVQAAADDLSGGGTAGHANEDGQWVDVPGTGDGSLLDPDGIVDDTLTVVVAILAGIVVGFGSLVMLLFVVESGWVLLLALVVWLGSTAYLSRRRTVQGAVSHGAYLLAAVLASAPVVAAIATSGGVGERAGSFGVAAAFAAIPVGILLVLGYVAGKFRPTEERQKATDVQ